MSVGVAVPGAGEGGVCAEGGITGEEGGGARVVVAGAEVLQAGWVGVFAGEAEVGGDSPSCRHGDAVGRVERGLADRARRSHHEAVGAEAVGAKVVPSGAPLLADDVVAVQVVHIGGGRALGVLAEDLG